jgi:uncharacterized protein (TIGR02266 family)
MEPSPNLHRGADRRVHPRLSVSVQVDFRSENNFYSARTRDISLGGLFLETSTALAIGAQLEVDLRFLKVHLRLPCEVMWVLEAEEGPVGVGVRFLELNEHARKKIEAFMALRAPLAFGDDDEPVVGDDRAPTPPPL